MSAISQDLMNDLVVFRKAADVSEKLLKDAADTGTPEADRALAFGLAAYELRKYDLAAESFERSYHLNRSGEAAIRLAMCHWRRRNFGEMETWASEAVSIDPRGQFVALIDEVSMSYLGVLSLAQFSDGNVKQAIATATDAVAIFKDDVMVLETLVKAHATIGAIQEASRFANMLPDSKKTLKDQIDALVNAGLTGTPIAMDIGVMGAEAMA